MISSSIYTHQVFVIAECQVAQFSRYPGSTAYPKPIPMTNRRFIELSLIPYFGERDLTNVILSLHSMPMYHGMGVLQCCWTVCYIPFMFLQSEYKTYSVIRQASCGLVISAFEPKSPAQLPTPDNLFQAAVATHSDVIFCVPAIIEAGLHPFNIDSPLTRLLGMVSKSAVREMACYSQWRRKYLTIFMRCLSG